MGLNVPQNGIPILKYTSLHLYPKPQLLFDLFLSIENNIWSHQSALLPWFLKMEMINSGISNVKFDRNNLNTISGAPFDKPAFAQY